LGDYKDKQETVPLLRAGASESGYRTARLRRCGRAF